MRGSFLRRALPGGLIVAGLASLLALATPKRLLAEEPPIPVIDLHVDLSYRSLYKKSSFAEGSGEFAAKDLLAAGVRGVVLPLFVPENAPPSGRTNAQFERSYAHVFESILKTPPYSLPGCSVGRAGASKRGVATWLAFEGAGPLGADEPILRKWVLRGVRSFGLVHSQSNNLATSSGKGPGMPTRDPGLTDEGRRFIRLVHRVGGVIDLSHASDESTNEAIRMAGEAGRSIVATHSNARALAPHARNLTDDQIRGISATGGVVGINFHQPFLRRKGAARADLHDVVRHVLHVREVGGLASVAIGSDFEGGISAVPELSDASRFQRLARALEEAGLSRADIRAVFFDNARRVLCSGNSASSH